MSLYEYGRPCKALPLHPAAGVPGALPSANACVRAGPMLGETLFEKRVIPQTPSLKT